MRTESRGSARVGSFRDAAARYAKSRRNAATEARRVGSACAARWPPVACSVAHPVCVAPQAPVVPSAWLQPGVFPAARRTAATVMVVSRGGLPRRSASWYQCLVKPWPSVCVCAPLATNRMLRYTAGNTRMEALVLICCSKVVITPGVAANSGPSIDVSSTANCAASTGRVPGLGGVSSSPVHRAFVLVLGTEHSR